MPFRETVSGSMEMMYFGKASLIARSGASFLRSVSGVLRTYASALRRRDGLGDDEIHFLIALLPDRYAVSARHQLVVHYVLQHHAGAELGPWSGAVAVQCRIGKV